MRDFFDRFTLSKLINGKGHFLEIGKNPERNTKNKPKTKPEKLNPGFFRKHTVVR